MLICIGGRWEGMKFGILWYNKNMVRVRKECNSFILKPTNSGHSYGTKVIFHPLAKQQRVKIKTF